MAFSQEVENDAEWERVVAMSLPREIDNADIIAVRDGWVFEKPLPRPVLVRSEGVPDVRKVVVKMGNEVIGVRWLRVLV